MQLTNKRFLIAGATGVLGSELARRLIAEECRVVLAGRNGARLQELGRELGAPTAALDFADPGSVERCLREAARALDAIDGVLVATGAVAFGAVGDVDDEVVRELFTVNALGPMALIGRARGMGATTVAAITGSVAETPTAGLAEFSASKEALSAYLAALRHETRRDGLLVLDVRPQHLDTGFADRALSGAPGRLPEPHDHREVAAAIVTALREDRRELAYDLGAKALVAR